MKVKEYLNSLARVNGTTRLDAFSDGVFAIIVTLLILEVKVPPLEKGFSNSDVLYALRETTPEFISFAFSFFVVAIYWVNHHHYMHLLDKTDWNVLWYNNHFLFWLCVIPFTTAFIGENPTQPIVVAVYAFVMMMSGLSFVMMGHHTFFRAPDLLKVNLPHDYKVKEFRRGYAGVGSYALATVLALIYVKASLVLLFLIPFAYFIPNLIQANKEENEIEKS